MQPKIELVPSQYRQTCCQRKLMYSVDVCSDYQWTVVTLGVCLPLPVVWVAMHHSQNWFVANVIVFWSTLLGTIRILSGTRNKFCLLLVNSIPKFDACIAFIVY